MTAKLTLTGDKEIDAMLKTLEAKDMPKALRKGTRAGAKVVLEDARRLVPIDTGTLQDTLVVRTAKGRSGKRLPRGTFGHAVTHKDTGAEDPFYAHFVEFGTVKWDGDRYIRQALYDNEDRVRRTNRQEIARAVDAIAAKTKRKTSV
jgi:HK97 gp10 family phage protein